MIEIISQKYIEFFSCFVALFGENKSSLIRFLVTNIAYHVVVLEPLPISETAIAIEYGLRIDSGRLKGLVEAALHVERVLELSAHET